MAYSNINKKRFTYLLRFGVGDDELRRFFSETRIPLILMGGKVQDAPRGYEARVNAMVVLPPKTDPIVQKWFSANITMLDPESTDELVETFRMYETANEPLPESDAKRLSRSCLIHLFSATAPQALVEFLRSPVDGNGSDSDSDHEPESDNESMQQTPPLPTEAVPLDPALAAALVALVEGKDPDEFVSGLSPAIASFVTGLYAAREGHAEETQNALEYLKHLEGVRAILASYATRHTKAKESAKPTIAGIQLIRLDENENPEFDFDRDEIIGICTKAISENAVFVRPFAIRTGSGKLLSLGRQDQREALFPSSGDVMAFSGRSYPKQPKRGEIGIWRIAQNGDSIIPNKTNFHLINPHTTSVYEVRAVPFKSDEYDSVREYIKEQSIRDKAPSETLLFLLRDDLIVGGPSGKDLAKDEGFESGLLCWSALDAFGFEGRILVPGPLPTHEQYECETLASSLKKLLLNSKTDPARPTKAQLRYLQEMLGSGEAHLEARRAGRLRDELAFIADHEGATEPLVEEAMQSEYVKARITELVQDKVNEQIKQKTALSKELTQLEKQLSDIKDKLSKHDKEQKTLSPAIAKAIKASVEKARSDAAETLGQVVVYKALMDQLPPSQSGHRSKDVSPALTVRTVELAATSTVDTLRSLGVAPRHARALVLTGNLAQATGIVLVVEGTASRLAAQAWTDGDTSSQTVIECGIGITDDAVLSGVVANAPKSIAILNANLSPIDVYARPLIDSMQRQLLAAPDVRPATRVLMSLTDSVAALPLPKIVEAMSVRISLDSVPDFMQADAVPTWLDESDNPDGGAGWVSRLWKPAAKRVLAHLKTISEEDAALVISVIEAVMR